MGECLPIGPAAPLHCSRSSDGSMGAHARLRPAWKESRAKLYHCQLPGSWNGSSDNCKELDKHTIPTIPALQARKAAQVGGRMGRFRGAEGDSDADFQNCTLAAIETCHSLRGCQHIFKLASSEMHVCEKQSDWSIRQVNSKSPSCSAVSRLFLDVTGVPSRSGLSGGRLRHNAQRLSLGAPSVLVKRVLSRRCDEF